MPLRIGPPFAPSFPRRGPSPDPTGFGALALGKINPDTVGGSAGYGANAPFTHTCGPNPTILFVFIRDDGSAVNGVTCNGAAMTNVAAVSDGAGVAGYYLYFTSSPVQGANVIVVGGSVNFGAASSSYSGARVSFIDAKVVNSLVSGTDLLTTLSPVADGCWAIYGVASRTGVNPVAGQHSVFRTAPGGGASLSLFDSGGIVPQGPFTMGAALGATTSGGAIIATFSPFVDPGAIAVVPSAPDGPYTLIGPWLTKPRGSSVLPIPSAPATPNTPSPLLSSTTRYSLMSWLAAGETKADVFLSTSPLPSYPAVVLNDAPVAYWRMNSVVGTTELDITGNAHNATIASGVTQNQAGALADGDPAMVFNGTSGHVDTPFIASPSTFTIEGWFKSSSTANLSRFLSNAFSAAGVDIVIVSTGLTVVINDGSTSSSPSSVRSGLIDNQWHHIVVTRDAPTTGALYIDGILDKTLTGLPSGVIPSSGITIGRPPVGANWFTGNIDEVALYATALSAAQVAAHYAARLITPVSVRQTGFSYVPTLAGLTNYYWQVNAVNDGGSTLGPVWRFSTYSATKLVSDIGGVMPAIARDSASVSMSTSQGTASFTVRDARPVPLTPFKMGLGTLDLANLIFSGNVQDASQVSEELTTNLRWNVTAIDSSFRFNRNTVWASYINVPGNVAAADLLARFAPEFTGVNIQSGLANVTLSFSGDSLDSALSSIATMAGGYYYRDFNDDVHLFIREVPALTPDALDVVNTQLQNNPPLTWSANTSQLRNKVIGIGAATSVPCDVRSGDTILPLVLNLFSPAGGTALIGSTVMTFAGTLLNASLSAPSVSVLPGAGIELGSHQYAYTDVSAAGETTPSPLATITLTAVLNPTVVPIAAVSVSGSLAVGTYQYAFTTVFAGGMETAASPLASVTIATTPGPSAAPTITLVAGSALPAGTYYYGYTDIFATGETAVSPAASVTIPLAAAMAAPVASLTQGGLWLGVGTYQYASTYVTPTGESGVSPSVSVTPYDAPTPGVVTGVANNSAGGNANAGLQYKFSIAWQFAGSGTANTNGNSTVPSATSALITCGTGGFDLTIPAWNGPAADALSWRVRIFCTVSGGGGAVFLLPLLTVVSSASSQVVTYNMGFSNAAIAAFTAAPGANTAYMRVIGLSLAAAPAIGTIGLGGSYAAINVYRTVLNGAQLKLNASYIPANINDSTVDGSLGANAPVVNLATLLTPQWQVSVTEPTFTTGRNLYRSAVNLTQLKMNQTVSASLGAFGFDSVLDGSLGVNAPVVGTALNTQPLVTINAAGVSGASGFNLYRTVAGGSQLKFVTTMGNGASNYYDSTPDGSLGTNVPVANNVVIQQVRVVVPVGPLGTLTRNVYRSKAGQTALQLTGSIANNTGTILTDVTADAALGVSPPTLNTAGLSFIPATTTSGVVAIGAVNITTASSGTSSFPDSGWLLINGQYIRYAHRSATNVFAGIPTSGPGAILQPIPTVSIVVAVPALYGINSNNGVPALVPSGTAAALYSAQNDTVSQSLVQALERSGNPASKSTGIYEYKLTDTSFTTQVGLDARCMADLTIFASAGGIIKISYTTLDPKSQVGRPIHVNLPAEGLLGDFIIQTVNIANIDEADGTPPRYTCTASSVRFSWEDLIRRILLKQ